MACRGKGWPGRWAVLKSRMTTLDDVMRATRKILENSGVDTPALDARILVRAATGLSDIAMIADGGQTVADKHQALIDAWLARRLAGEPVSRILGEKEFYGRDFKVTPATLDPRPDTETLIERALDWAMAQKRPLRILDLGAGTGCILITLLAELPDATGVAVDINQDAIAVSRENAVKHGVETRSDFAVGSWFDPVAGERFDLIVSNPPYIPDADIESLAPEVRNHDPILALAGGIDGLDPYKIIFSGLKNHLLPGGMAYLEFGFGQAESLARLVDDSHLFMSRITPDLGGIPRVVEISNGEK